MDILTVGVLKQILDRMPEDFSVEYDKEGIISPFEDMIEIDISGKRLILKV